MMEEPLINVGEYVNLYSDTLRRINQSSLQGVIDFLRGRNYGRVFTVGNGGSMSTAEHMASDLNKWANSEHPKNRIVAQCLNSNPPEISALINDVGWPNIYRELLEMFGAKSRDVLIAYSVHGGKGKERAGKWSENVTGAIEFMNDIEGTTIGITGSDGGVFKDMCDYCVIVPSSSTPIVEGLHSVVSHIIVDHVRVPLEKRISE